MSIRTRACAAALLFMVGWMAASGQSLQSVLQQKLHPAFQALVAESVPTALPKAAGVPGPASVANVGGLPLYDAIITTTDAAALSSSGVHVNSVVGKYATARVTVQDLVRLAQRPEVLFLEPGAIDHPALDLSVPETGANLLHGGFINSTPYKGKGVIVLVFDTGIDWRHLDFRDPVDTTKSRILAIWDQTLQRQGTELNPSGFSYGVEYTKAQIDNELDGTPTGVVRERDIEGHGTHVAGIAAGNGSAFFQKYVGMAPEADIVVVKGGDNSFSESNEMDALSYAASKASQFGEPVAVNMSVGGQSGSHDGTRPSEVAVNDFIKSPGKVVVISAGNDGDEMIHASGTINNGGSSSISITVPSYTPTSGTNNDKFTLEVWFDSAPALNATVITPGGHSYSTAPGTTSEGTISISNFVSLSNNNRCVTVTVSDASTSVPSAGVWTVTLSGASQSAAYEAWLSSWTVGSSSVSITNGNSQRTVAMPGTAEGAITVASYVTKTAWTSFDGRSWQYSAGAVQGAISSFSSVGPTGDGRQKPDVAAPGQGIASVLSSSVDTSTIGIWVVPSSRYFISQGTSMAAPHVTGASALLLQISRGLTAAQIKSLLTSTAAADASTGSVPNVNWGYGKMDVLKAAVKAINPQAVLQRETLAYDKASTNQVLVPYLAGTPGTTTATKYALRISPTISGRVTSLQVNITTTSQNPIQGVGPLLCEVWTNIPGSVGGIPGTKIGSTISVPFARLSAGTNNIVDMTASNASVTAGQDYHVVLSVSNPNDLIKMRVDAEQPVTNRSSVYDGSKWINLVDPTSGLTQANIRIRAVVTSLSGLVSVEHGSSVPDHFSLMQNYPNPFNPSTTIRYSVPAQGRMRLRIFDVIGREVASLVDEIQSAGTYVVEWQARDNAGHQLASGVYFYRLDGDGQTVTKKMMLMK